jgi:hypothetical protein
LLSLNDLIGKTVIISPKQKFRPEADLYAVTLHGVEVGGIWVEHPVLSGVVAASVHKTVEELPNDPVFFFPYSEIEHLVAFSPRIDPKALGL